LGDVCDKNEWLLARNGCQEKGKALKWKTRHKYLDHKNN
jgi:hypothetical protein